MRDLLATLRGLLLLGFWFTAIAVLAPFLILARLVSGNERAIYVPVRPFIRFGLWMVGVRVEVTGAERMDPRRPYIITPNHQSLIEVPLFVAYLGRDPGYLAKKEVFKYPIFGYGIKLMGVVPIDRSNSATAIANAQRATERLKGGKTYIIYPEGTRSYDGSLLPFKKGAFVMAIEAGVPVVPVTVSGAAAIMPRTGIRVHPGTIHVTVHEPVEASGYSRATVEQLMAEVRRRIESALTDAERRGRAVAGRRP